MDGGLTFSAVAALCGIMVAGAVVPGVSVLTVAARSAALGFRHGVATTAGVVAGDILFIVIALYGLAFLAHWMGGHFVFIRYIGAAYLIGMGVVLWRSKARDRAIEAAGDASLWASFLAGLLLTLADQKAILFYLGLLPAFVDGSAMTMAETGAIVLLAIVAVGGPKLAYAFMAARSDRMIGSPRTRRALNIAAGTVMAGAGIWLMLRP